MPEIDILNDCLYCHKEYKPNIANHYCDDCVMKCDTCHTIRGLWCFNFNYETEAYKNWKLKGCHGILEKAGRITTCGSCKRNDETDPIKILQRAAARLKPGQLELLLASQGKK